MEIRAQSTFQNITWVIRDFWELPQEIKFLDSPEFLYGGDPYGIRLYPKMNGNETVFYLQRLSGNSPEKEVSCEIKLRKRERNGDERYANCPGSFQKNLCYSTSLIERNRDGYVPDGSLTIVCTMSGAGSSAQGEEEQGGFPGNSASFSSRRSPAKMELTTQFPCTRVRLTVRNVFQLLGESWYSLDSPEFRFAGDTYCFRFEPNGDTEDTDLRLVRLTSTYTENAVYYRVGYDHNFCTVYPCNIRSLVGNTGFCVSLTTLEKERDKYVPYGNLYLTLSLHLGEQSSAGAGTTDAVQNGTGLTDIEKLQSDYRRVLQNETESDACFVVRGKELRVHRVVLRARSKVFEAMFGHDTAEKESGRVVVDDLDPDTFGDFLEYLYTGDVEAGLSDDNTFKLYVAADKYDVSNLKSKCVKHMRLTLSVDSFCDVLNLALRYGEDDLLQQAIKFFKDNLQSIIVTAKWQQFVLDNGTAANELFIKAFVPGKQ